MWSFNDGLSGNLLETFGNRPRRFLAGYRIFFSVKVFSKFFFINKKNPERNNAWTVKVGEGSGPL
jgi:hypothetical protein